MPLSSENNTIVRAKATGGIQVATETGEELMKKNK